MGISLAEVKTRGWKALVKELGYAGATKFVLLYEPGKGNYVEERRELFKEVSVKDIIAEVKRTGSRKKDR